MATPNAALRMVTCLHGETVLMILVISAATEHSLRGKNEECVALLRSRDRWGLETWMGTFLQSDVPLSPATSAVTEHILHEEQEGCAALSHSRAHEGS